MLFSCRAITAFCAEAVTGERFFGGGEAIFFLGWLCGFIFVLGITSEGVSAIYY